MIHNITDRQYQCLKRFVKRIYPDNYEDILHDAILKHDTIEDCKRGLQSFNNSYRGTSKGNRLPDRFRYCTVCKETLPIIAFSTEKTKYGVLWTRNQCKKCRVRLDSKNRLIRCRKWRENNRGRYRELAKNYRMKLKLKLTA